MNWCDVKTNRKIEESIKIGNDKNKEVQHMKEESLNKKKKKKKKSPSSEVTN